MNDKLLFLVLIIGLIIGITAFNTVVNAKGLNLMYFKKQNITVILKNEANIEMAKDKISKIPQVRISNIQYRDKEWSKMVNKMDLPKMENPFKNEFTLKINKNADINEICNKIKEIDFVEDIKYNFDAENTKK